MFYSIRSKLITSFLAVTLVLSAFALFIGGHLLHRAAFNEGRNRVRLDLNSARATYHSCLEAVRCPVFIISAWPTFGHALKSRDFPELVRMLGPLSEMGHLDFLGIVTKDRETICRLVNGTLETGSLPGVNPIAQLALENGVPVSGTLVLSEEVLRAESPELARRARISLSPAFGEGNAIGVEETSGMVLASASPVFEKGKLVGVIYGGILLNQNEKIVDTVRDEVFENEKYKGRSVGTATIFLNGLRIATNVMLPDGRRAVGTVVSKEVEERVLKKGETWSDRAYVVNDWYITAYEPIRDISGHNAGILYVGILEEKYLDIRTSDISIFIIITAAGMVLAIGLGYLLAKRIMKPVFRLITASMRVSDGDLSLDIGPISRDEIGILQNTFKNMVLSLKARDMRTRTESENRLVEAEKQASVGRLAAGVAHEINNPLTGVLTYSHMLLRRKDIDDSIRSDLEVIVKATERVRIIVKGLLDFSRQTALDPEPSQINRLIASTVLLLEKQALLRGVSLKFNPGGNLPELTLDRNRFGSVLINIIINAIDVSRAGDTVTITTGINVSVGDDFRKGVEITISDTGCGIPPENLNKLFEPFFTTKEVGKGTGLGLAVSYGIVQRHQGDIRVQSEVGKGTTFIIWLPINE